MEKLAPRVRLSIIIPTYKREKILKQALELIAKQIDSRLDEVIVVEGPLGPAKARNEAMKKARGELVLFLNDDSFIELGFIKKHLDFHRSNKGRNVGLVGMTENHPETINLEAMKWLVGQSGLHFNYRFVNGGQVHRIPWYYLWTCNFSVKRSFVAKMKNWFCEEFPTAAWEDIEFAYRAKKMGLKLYFDKSAKVWHFHELTFKDIKSRFISHGMGLRHLKNKLPTNFLPFLIKNNLGYMLLRVMQWKAVDLVRDLLEYWLVRADAYPNIIMQWLVVKWKSDGYYKEEKRLSGM